MNLAQFDVGLAGLHARQLAKAITVDRLSGVDVVWMPPRSDFVIVVCIAGDQ